MTDKENLTFIINKRDEKLKIENELIERKLKENDRS